MEQLKQNVTDLPGKFWNEAQEKDKKSSWSDSVKNGVFHGVKKVMNFLHTTKRRKANWIGRILRKTAFWYTLWNER